MCMSEDTIPSTGKFSCIIFTSSTSLSTYRFYGYLSSHADIELGTVVGSLVGNLSDSIKGKLRTLSAIHICSFAGELLQ